MKTECPRELGIGVVYSPRLARVLDLESVDVLEIEPQMFWRSTGDPSDPIEVDHELLARLRAMPQHKLVHSVTLALGNSRPHDPRALERLAESIVAVDAPYASEHLSFNQFNVGAERLWTGFLLPPKQTRDGVDNAAARIDEMRRAVGVPVAFETGVNYLQPQGDELSDGAFVRRVAEAADCGILLDLHNLLANERNGRDSMRSVLEEIPRERVWEIHLAGGMDYRGYWVDSHSSHIEEGLFRAARGIVDECPNLRAIVFEIMEQYVDESSRDALRSDVRALRSLWTERLERRSGRVPRPPRPALPDAVQATTDGSREETLGALALGMVPRDPDARIVADPAPALYADLVASMREGVLYETLPFTIRLLLASLGPQTTMDLIDAYRAMRTPKPFGADEARQFIGYVGALDLEVPHLAAILEFEGAVLAVEGAPGTRTVTFECDPTALFDALMARRPPGDLPRERFYVDVSASGVKIRRGAVGPVHECPTAVRHSKGRR